MIVVTGATGNVGSALVRLLADAGEKVRAVSRRITPKEVPQGAVAHRADLRESSQLGPALDGAEALFLLTPPELLDAPHSLRAAVARARELGVRRIVLLSSQGVGTGRHPDVFERQVIESGLDWTILRPGAFHPNALQWAPSIRAERLARAPFAEVALPSVDPIDIAAVAAPALSTDRHAGRTYALTGPEAVTPRERVELIAAALGEPVGFVEQSEAEARSELLAFMPAEAVEGTLSVLGHPAGEEQQVSPAVAEVLGRPARSFAVWAQQHVEAFR